MFFLSFQLFPGTLVMEFPEKKKRRRRRRRRSEPMEQHIWWKKEQLGQSVYDTLQSNEEAHRLDESESSFNTQLCKLRLKHIHIEVPGIPPDEIPPLYLFHWLMRSTWTCYNLSYFLQIEGAFVQGIGFFMLEEYLTNSNGLVVVEGTWTYKIPTLDTIPKQFNVQVLNSGHHQKRVLSSKGMFLQIFALYANGFLLKKLQDVSKN